MTAAQPAPLAALPAPAAAARPCVGKTIYIQIYGLQDRDAVRDRFREPWRALGASVPPIEDVLALARSRGVPAPAAVRQTTVRYHDISSLQCANSLMAAVGQTGWRVEPLVSSLKASRNVIEVWVPPQPR